MYYDKVQNILWWLILRKRIVNILALDRILELCKSGTDSVSLLAIVVFEIYYFDDWFDWTGFIGLKSQNMYKIGPYQVGIVG